MLLIVITQEFELQPILRSTSYGALVLCDSFLFHTFPHKVLSLKILYRQTFLLLSWFKFSFCFHLGWAARAVCLCLVVFLFYLLHGHSIHLFASLSMLMDRQIDITENLKIIDSESLFSFPTS